jgi:hypothetical protein
LPAELDLLKWGVAIARKGGVPKACVLNAMSLDEIRRQLDARRGLRAGPPRTTRRPRAARPSG